MNLIYELSSATELANIYKPWGSANYNYQKIIESKNLDWFFSELEDIFPSIEITQLNDILWFNDNFCFQFINDELLNEEELQIKYNY